MGQSKHAADPATANVPFPQSVQLAALYTALNEPSGHGSHTSEFILRAVPGTHAGVGAGVGEGLGDAVGVGVGDGVGITEQFALPVTPVVHVPTAHDAHSLSPILLVYLPDGQLLQAVRPAAFWNLPAAHAWQAPPVDGWNFPAGQSEHVATPEMA
jgi:hypothetical protein